jgi:hypothetical protein
VSTDALFRALREIEAAAEGALTHKWPSAEGYLLILDRARRACDGGPTHPELDDRAK